MAPPVLKNEDSDLAVREPAAKKSKKSNGKAQAVKSESSESMFMTEATTDENIYPDATFQSYEEFDQKFNVWKAKNLHPFRVASSESLRTEDGSISEKFKYRYVVFHCARYGVPRMRGEGKRPNQNYLPCSCTAMIRLNFQFHEQCLRLTSLETRHSNHTICKDLYEKMCVKEEKRKHVTPRRTMSGPKSRSSSVATAGNADTSLISDRSINVKKEPSEERADSEHSHGQSPVDLHYEVTRPYEVSPSAPISEITTPFVLPTQKVGLNDLVPTSQFSPMDYQSLQNQIILNQVKLNAMTNNVYNPFGNWPASSLVPTPAPPFLTPTPSQVSPALSSSVDENEAPKIFHSLEAVRPIPLRPSQNSAFYQMLNSSSTSPIIAVTKAEVDSVLGAASRLLNDNHLPEDVLHSRVKQLNGLISQWTHS